MSKIARATQKIFGSSAGTNQIAQIGSLAAASPVFSTNLATIQALNNYLQGWFNVVVGSNSPAIEDMNALCFLITQQLAYGFQSGVAEWDSGTTYFIGSLVNDGSGNIYRSIVDTNLNQAITDTTKWLPVTRPLDVAIDPGTQSPYTMTANDQGKTFEVNTANGAQTFTLPTAANGYQFTVKDSAGSCGTNNITIALHAAESIEGLAASFLCKAEWGIWTFESNGTNWFLV